ncbi:MAG: hypothetical protein QJR09_05160 [Micrococcus sp.]|nr:hypothetical protein [Micrococcus sp.]
MTDAPRVTIEKDLGDRRTVRVEIPQGKQSRFVYLTPEQAQALHRELGAHVTHARPDRPKITDDPTIPDESRALAVLATGDDQLED